MISTNAYALLALLSIKPMTGYEMKKWVELALSQFWKTSFGQIYPTMSKFISLGMVSMQEIENEKTPNSKLYTLTDLGREALLTWLNSDFQDFTDKDEALLKFYFSTILPVDVIVHRMNQAIAFNSKVLSQYEEELKALEKDKYKSRHNIHRYLSIKKGIHLNQARIKWEEECVVVMHEFERQNSSD